MLDKDKIVKERIINNEYPKKEIHEIDHSKLLVMLYSHIPFVLADVNLSKESELLDFIKANRMQYIKLSCAWKDMRIKGYKAMKANRNVLYLMAFAEYAVYDEDGLQKIVPVIAEMINKELIRSSHMILYRLEAKDKSDMSIRYDIYDTEADMMPINDKHLIYSASIYNLYLRDALKHLIDEYISVSHDMQTLEKDEFGKYDEIHLNVDGHYYAYLRILPSLFPFVGGVFPRNMIPLTFYNIKVKW
ncbi:hypothetical protein [Cloacibacillus sp. An23]|uniref:hypothetical protein n=1 Tax=Cloacibacillus sp. An23 TaxID=1965591 RepID=UPI001178B837|nr:hypothetical protein [Cloacibacillus sp. An23]